jgi:hypothetical protein
MDGSIMITFSDDSQAEYSFNALKGWRFEATWLKVWFETSASQWPSTAIKKVETTYNSKAVQDQITAGNASQDFVVCTKCGGTITATATVAAPKDTSPQTKGQ